LFDRAEPGMDTVLSRELGRSLGANFDSQVITGTGANGQMLGLRAVTGITSNSYTDASPTQAEAFPVVNKTYADDGAQPVADRDPHAPSPLRLVRQLEGQRDRGAGAAQVALPGGRGPTIGTTYGAATNEDEIYVLRADELPIYAAPPAFRISFDLTGSGSLIVRVTAYQYVSALFTRRPEAIGKIGGTGLTPPVWT
jgi:hypothetical protein